MLRQASYMNSFNEGRAEMIRNVLEYLERTNTGYSDKPAFVDDESCLTFGEVSDKSKKVGTALIKFGSDRKPVAVYMEKTPFAVVAFFGVVYSGRCYSPIDSQMPVKRVEQILQTLDTDYLIVDGKTKTKIQETTYQGRVLLIDDLLQIDIQETQLEEIRNKMIDTDPLYIIFTSGSTGIPKGVVLSHRAIIDLTEWLGETFAFNSTTVFGNQTPFYFDASVKDIYSTIRNAATMYIIPRKFFGFSKKLFMYLNEKKINSILWATSALCLSDGEKAFETAKPKYLRLIAFAGEAMPAKHLNIWKKHIPDAVFVNLYGPTEAAVDAAYYIVDRDFAETESIPIGKVCRNMEILILKGDKPALLNEIGEICIRGTALANGYYRDIEMTDEKFVQNPLHSEYPERIYRTGDLCYYNKNGEIIFVARKDDQIKHRGYRVELGDIETALSGFPGVDRCCCLFDKGKDQIVCVYSGNAIPRSIILEAGKCIPKYMWPNAFIRLEELPINLNGKIDRKKLYEECIHD